MSRWMVSLAFFLLLCLGCSESDTNPADAPPIPPGRSAVGPEAGEQDPVGGQN